MERSEPAVSLASSLAALAQEKRKFPIKGGAEGKTELEISRPPFSGEQGVPKRGASWHRKFTLRDRQDMWPTKEGSRRLRQGTCAQDPITKLQI